MSDEPTPTTDPTTDPTTTPPSLLLPIDDTNPMIIHANTEMALMSLDTDMQACYLQAIQGFANLNLGPIDIEQLTLLLNMENIMALTNSPDEWTQLGTANMWQNTRNAKAFSTDGGNTYYILDGNAITSAVAPTVVTPAPTTDPTTS